MSNAVLDKSFKKTSEIALPESYKGIKEHNLYLYVKSYLASLRANNAKAKKRGEVSGGGKKPWAQKGGGRARAGSITSPVFVGGGVAHGPSNNRNYDLKINKKQKRLALEYAIKQKAEAGKLYVVDSLSVESGRQKMHMLCLRLLMKEVCFLSLSQSVMRVHFWHIVIYRIAILLKQVR